MKLGISYPVFEGEELLPFILKEIRNSVDFVSVVYQPKSYLGNPAHEDLEDNLLKIKEIDFLVKYENDYSLKPRENEINVRNLGLDLSRKFGCTHHISADCDEFYELERLEYVKKKILRI